MKRMIFMDEFTKNDDFKHNVANQILEIEKTKEIKETDISKDDNANSDFLSNHSNDIENPDTSFDDIPEKIDMSEANTTNCLALTIKKDYKLVAVKNVFIHSIKVTWKVIVSSIALRILKIFF